MAEIFQERGLSVDLYDRMYSQKLPGSPVAGDVNFYIQAAKKTGGPILELGVGTGRVALPMANAGLKVTGLDTSSAMLRLLKRKITAFPPREPVRLVRANMARFSLGRRFPLVIIPFRAFQHLLTPEAQRSCLTCVRRHLAAGGKFILDIFDPLLGACVPERKSAGWANLRIPDPDRHRKITVTTVHRRNDPLRQVLKEKWVFTVRGRAGGFIRRATREVELRWTYRYEMKYLLELAGFKVLACYGDFRGGPPRYGAEQIWVATR
jgi:SAM-dependent methyltransferase